MKTKQLNASELNLVTLAAKYSDEDKARKLFESLLWPNGVVCPHCKNTEKEKGIYTITPRAESKTPARKGLYKCAACRKQFTVRVGTILEDSHIPISKWIMAMFIICSSKKAISAHQLHRMLGMTYKSAWFLAHRIRFAMNPDNPLGKLLQGVVEADETFIGGKGDRRSMSVRKTPVMALIERNGSMRTRVIASVTQKNLKFVLNETVCKTSVVNTDDHAGYRDALKGYKKHDVVNHSRYEYFRRNPDGTCAGINTCESFFSLLKRGVHGSWHHVSREHLPKYAGEFAFRWNTRKLTDGERMAEAVLTTEGKRLTYRQCV